MFKGCSGAIGFVLVVLVLSWFLPEVFDLTIEIIVKILKIINDNLDNIKTPMAMSPF